MSLRESRGVVLEVNADPGLYYHYMKSDGGVPVARMILERAIAAPGRSSAAPSESP